MPPLFRWRRRRLRRDSFFAFNFLLQSTVVLFISWNRCSLVCRFLCFQAALAGIALAPCLLQARAWRELAKNVNEPAEWAVGAERKTRRECLWLHFYFTLHSCLAHRAALLGKREAEQGWHLKLSWGWPGSALLALGSWLSGRAWCQAEQSRHTEPLWHQHLKLSAGCCAAPQCSGWPQPCGAAEGARQADGQPPLKQESSEVPPAKGAACWHA